MDKEILDGSAEDFFNQYAKTAKAKEYQDAGEFIKPPPVVDENSSIEKPLNEDKGSLGVNSVNKEEVTTDIKPEVATEVKTDPKKSKLKELEVLEKNEADKLNADAELKAKKEKVLEKDEVGNEKLSMEEIKKHLAEELKKSQEESEKKVKAEKEAAEKKALEEKAISDAKAKEEAEKNWDPESLFSEEEKKDMEKLTKDFPEVLTTLKAYEKKLNAVNEKRLENTINAYHEHISKMIAPLLQGYQMQEVQSAKQQILNVHPDFDSLIQPVEQWISSMPDGKIKSGLKSAFDEGTNQDIIELFNQYKMYNGLNNKDAKTEDANKAKEDADKKVLENAEKAKAERIKKEKAEALGAVSSSATQIEASPDAKSKEDWFNIYSNPKKK